MQKTNLYFNNYTEAPWPTSFCFIREKCIYVHVLRYWNTQWERSISIVCVYPSFCRSHANFMQKFRYSDLQSILQKKGIVSIITYIIIPVWIPNWDKQECIFRIWKSKCNLFQVSAIFHIFLWSLLKICILQHISLQLHFSIDLNSMHLK